MEKMQALQKNETWEVVDLPKGKNPVRCKWVFNVKYKADGTIERYKNSPCGKRVHTNLRYRLYRNICTGGKLNTIRVLLSLAANLDWPLQQLNIKNAFLNGKIGRRSANDSTTRLLTSKRKSGLQTKKVTVWT